jgi:hypothetical protein
MTVNEPVLFSMPNAPPAMREETPVLVTVPPKPL